MKNKKNVFVSGASKGIGKAIALKFAKEGYNLCINSKKSTKLLLELEEEILSLGVACISFIGDISNYQEADKFFSLIYERFHTIDVLVNNAGVSHIGLFQDMDIDTWNYIISNNLNSCFNCSKLAIPGMIKEKSGKIINISSVWGISGASCEVAYSSSKGAINAFTKSLAKELAPSNIQVNAIACGMIDTDMNSCFDDDEKSEIVASIPALRMGSPDEVANLACYLARADSYLNGQIISLDGAWL